MRSLTRAKHELTSKLSPVTPRLSLFCIISWRIWRSAQLARDEFGMLVCVGVLCLFMFQIFENVGMTMGIMPVTGMAGCGAVGFG